MTSANNSSRETKRRKNFATWKFPIQTLLERENLWGCIEEKPEYIIDFKKMSKARAKIIFSLDKHNYITFKKLLLQKPRGIN